MSKKQKLIPEIRFPEFKNEGEWEEVTLGYLSQIVKGEQLNRIELTETGKYPCQNGGINPSGYTDKFNTNENTITISEGGNSCGYINYMTSKFWLGGHCYKLVVNHRIDKSYLYQALKFNEEDIMRLRVGSGLPNIQQNAIRNFKFVISNFLPEQQKIASCLSSLDDLIKEHSQKLDLLKDHKKGLMQNLFPQKGEKVPNYRFKEFEKDGEWEIKTIGEIANSESSSIALNNLELKPTGYPVYGADSIVGYIDEFQHKEKYISIVKDGSGVGRLNICQSNSSILGTLTSLKSKNKKQFDLDWIYYLLNTVDFSVYVKGAGIPHIYYSDFKNENIPVPTPKEQQKIAFCLSSLDELIKEQSEKNEQLKLHKKGLMQGLFPKIEN